MCCYRACHSSSNYLGGNSNNIWPAHFLLIYTNVTLGELWAVCGTYMKAWLSARVRNHCASQSLLVVSMFSSIGWSASFTQTFSEAGSANDSRHEFCRMRLKGGRNLFQIISIWHMAQQALQFSARAAMLHTLPFCERGRLQSSWVPCWEGKARADELDCRMKWDL